MPRKKRESKYKCQYCERPLDNLTTKTSHELACPQNPKNQTVVVPKTESKRGKKTPSGKPPIRKGLEREDELLQQYPTIEKLKKDVEQLKVIPGAIKANQEANQVQIAQLGNAIGKLNVVMTTLANQMSNPSQVPKANPEKTQLSQGNTQADEALQASLAADKEKIGQTPGEEGTDAGGKMEKLRKEAEEKKVAGSGQPGQVETGGVDPSLAGMADMPEGIQKIMLYATLAEKFLPLINSLRGVQQPQSAQTVEDRTVLDRTFQNMVHLLKLTDGLRKEVRKDFWDEVRAGYTLTPKGQRPITSESKDEGLE